MRAEGPSGLRRIAQRGEITGYVRSLGEVRLSNGSRIYPPQRRRADRLRGFNLAAAWCEEAAVWPKLDNTWHGSLMPAVRRHRLT